MISYLSLLNESNLCLLDSMVSISWIWRFWIQRFWLKTLNKFFLFIDLFWCLITYHWRMSNLFSMGFVYWCWCQRIMRCCDIQQFQLSKFSQWIYHLHSRNGNFDAKLFIEDCKIKFQTQSFSGVRAHHQNVLANQQFKPPHTLPSHK